MSRKPIEIRKSCADTIRNFYFYCSKNEHMKHLAVCFQCPNWKKAECKDVINEYVEAGYELKKRGKR